MAVPRTNYRLYIPLIRPLMEPPSGLDSAALREVLVRNEGAWREVVRWSCEVSRRLRFSCHMS